MSVTTKIFIKIVVTLFLGVGMTCSYSQQTDDTTPPATEAVFNPGEILYDYRCKVCHEPATPGAPSRKRLGRMEAGEIIEAMSKGEMKLLAGNLTDEEMRLIAEFLSEI